MKRLLVIACLSCATALSVPAVAGAQQPIYPTRVAPASFTAKTTPSRDRTRPYKFKTTGAVGIPAVLPLICPPGATTLAYCVKPPVAFVCSGSVTVTFKKGFITVSSKTVALAPNCTYSSSATFKAKKKPGKLSVRVAFSGNLLLNGASAPNQTVRGG